MRRTIAEGALYLALALLAFSCIAGIVIALGGNRP